MPVIAISPGSVDYSGVNVSGQSDIPVDASEPVVYSGVPISFETVTETPSTTPDSVRVRVLNAAGTFIRHLDRLDGLRWGEELNSPGAGSIDILRHVPADVLAAGNQFIVSVGARDVFRLVLDAEPGYRIDDQGNRVDAWAGTGALGVLNSGMVIPEYGWRNEATDERTFDYGSNPAIGGWYVSREWKTPVGKPVRKSWRWTYKKRHLPKGWPDRKAQWLWWRNPDSRSVPDEICYFQSSFTLAAAARVKFWVCGDDTLELQVDGEVRATAGPGGWKKPTKVVMQLSAGTHTVAAKVQNAPSTDGNQNRAGFLCTIAKVTSDGEVIKYLRRTTPNTWKVRRQLSAAPGWFPAQILKRLVEEQVSRGCASHSGITYGFTTATDSTGRAWVGRREWQIPIRTLGLDWAQQIVELGVDVYMSPTLRLYAWRSRGADRSRTVRINGKVLEESGSPESPIRNVAYARAKTGWVGVSHTSSVASRGRREVGITLGGSRSVAQTRQSLNQMLPDLAAPPQTIQLKISGATGPQPFRNFNVGDWISARPAGKTGWTRYRVMGYAAEINPAGHPDWTLSLYED